MTRAELANWVQRARALFRGDWDETTFAVALPRIAAAEYEDAVAALDDYAAVWGGDRSRFIASRFWESLERHRARRRESSAEASAERRLAWGAEANAEARRVAAEWRAIAERVADAPASERARALAILAGFGWGSPPADPSRWGRSWTLAVDDLIRGTACPARDGSGGWGAVVGPVEFWGRAPRPSEIAASGLG